MASFAEAAPTAANAHFAIHIVDSDTGRGVPLVELRTVNKAAWWTDSNGIVAFDEPGLMDREVFFHVQSPGYEMPADFLGNRGVKLKTQRGGGATIKLKRLNIAERLYRVTGQGIYRDSLLVGHPVPLAHPVLNGEVTGQDTVIATPYRGKIYWFWGDTDRASYPLGNFGASGATSELPGQGGLDPSMGVDLAYFVDATGFSKPVCPLTKAGMRWIESLLTLPDEQGVERLLARVGIMPDLDHATEWDLMAFDDVKNEFELIRRWDIHDPHQSAHPFQARVVGTNYYYLFPDFRVPADWATVGDLSQYEAFTCLAGDGKWRGRESKMDREETGRVRYTWRKGADRLYGRRLDELVEAEKLQRDETWARLFDFETGTLLRELESVAWNPFRKRWIAFVADEDKPGEVWFAEADSPLGPWGYGRRVVTHGNYNFYNVAHHPFLNQDGSRIVYFEGTYSDTFSGARTQTPRYDYNQIMYRLALDDTRLALPVAVYRVRETNSLTHLWLRDQVEAAGAWARVEEVAWFALPPSCREKGLVPVYANDREPAVVLTTTSARLDIAPLFAGLPLVETESELTVDGLWNCRAEASGDGGALNFPLQMSLQGSTVRVGEPGNALTGTGQFDQGKLKLTLTLTNEQKSFTLEARINGRTLEGEWRENHGPDKGTWSASRPDPTPPERRSPALAVLREYRKSGHSGYDYSIETQPPPGCLPEGRPICRVWRAPGSVLALDWKAKPNPARERN